MNKTLKTLMCASLLAVFGTATADSYDVQERAVKDRYDASAKRCDGLSGNAEDVCEQQAKADRDIGLAEIDASRKNTDAARLESAKVRAKANYAVANERCDDLAGNKKDVCQEKAKAERDKTLAEIEARKEGGSALDEAAKEKREADYKVAKERCDDLAGDAQTTCVNEAKRRYAQ
ncbi:hypothetical protein [Chitinolyticbacter albus]|uniref:hypothetical protein n=1 Tax=Chitinolyticbacter albus TaxID=2961951 RepID=UPI00210DD49A|nr:hypothetical protein [Chitinolyticbacter albus]